MSKPNRPRTDFTPRALAMLEVGVTLPVLTRAYRAAADQAVAHLGVSQALAWPLVMIGRHDGPVRSGELAELLGIEPPSLVRPLDQLVNAGLVTRVADPEDRRARLIDVTPLGAETCARIEDALKAMRDRLYAGLSDEDLAACLRVFGALQQQLGHARPVLPPQRPQGAD